MYFLIGRAAVTRLPDYTNGAEQQSLETVRTMGGRIWPPKTGEKQIPKVGRSMARRRTEPSLDSNLEEDSVV